MTADKRYERLFCCECGVEVPAGNAGRVIPALQPGTGGVGGSPRPHVWCARCLAFLERLVEHLATLGADRRVLPTGPWPPGAEPVVSTSSLREALAAYAHEVWSGWMKYLFKKSMLTASGSVEIPWAFVERWQRQLETTYADLPEEEKESDRAEADKMLEICRRHAPLKFAGWFLGKRGAVEAVLTEAKRELKFHRPSAEMDVADVMDALDGAGLLQ